MYWIIGAVAVVGVVAWLNGEEEKACSNYYAASHRLTKETTLRQQQITLQRTSYRNNQNFYEHINLHHASHLTAAALYDALNHHKKIVAMFRAKKQSFGECICKLKKQRDVASGAQKQLIRGQLEQMRQQFKEAKEQLVVLAEEKERKLVEIREINQATREYKLYIRDNCGTKGNDWYERGVERARLRAA